MTPEQVKREIERLQALLDSKKDQASEAVTPEEVKNEAEELMQRAEEDEEQNDAEGSDVLKADDSPKADVLQTDVPGTDALPRTEVSQTDVLPKTDVLPQRERAWNVAPPDSDRSLTREQLQASLRMEAAVEMCRRVAEGESLQSICREPGQPSLGIFLRWCSDDPEFGRMYTTALRLRAAVHAEMLLGDMEDLDEKDISQARVQAIKVKINTRQWLMSRLLPKQYGEKIEHEHSGEVKMDEKQIDSRLQVLLAKIAAK